MDGQTTSKFYTQNTPKILDKSTSTPPKSMPKPPKIEPKTLQNRGLEGIPLEIAFRSQIEPHIFQLLGGVLGCPGSVLGASRGRLGAALGVLGRLGSVLRALWDVLGASWNFLLILLGNPPQKLSILPPKMDPPTSKNQAPTAARA